MRMTRTRRTRTRQTRTRRTRTLVVAALAGTLLAGGGTLAATSGVLSTGANANASGKPADTISNAGAAIPAPRKTTQPDCSTDTADYEVRNHVVDIKSADLKLRITRCVDSDGNLTSGTTMRIYGTTTTAGDFFWGASVTPEPAPALLKSTDSQYILQQDVEHKTCLGTKLSPLCDHNDITFTVTVNSTGQKWSVDSKDTSADDDIVAVA
ncbi:hypothetical protein [Streptomyces sp. 35G-GA-8]|uniref:hypothetical protein n=1 Tax=Streptomyces sp. 35G-GA-8 TaxID=2939434 RepID=UPI00201F346E|nr:hypothetical protein [Streptomyces sp. 35G-GA-8]MCL7380807.1 hypothetical protein [Streptomyces sp. 35G-GA-8]